MKPMYNSAINSRETYLMQDIDEFTTNVAVLDGDILPEAPNLLTIGNTEDAETVLLVEKLANVLTIQRGYEGAARPWQAETPIARNFCAADYDAICENIGEISQNIEEIEKDVGEIFQNMALQKDLDTATTNISNIQKDVTTAKSDITTLKTDATNAKNHIAKVDNPHKVTAKQVGLETAAADITTLKTESTNAKNHIAKTDNPHKVTAKQVGLETAAADIKSLKEDGIPLKGLKGVQTITCKMADLRATVLGLPRHLVGNVTINVQPGTTTETLSINDFYGNGVLTIRAVNAAGEVVAVNNSTTHKIAKASASRCRCAYLILQGFNFTSTAAESKVTISECGGVGHIDLRYLHINGGTPATAKTVGFHILRTSTTIWCRDVTVSNQHRAVTLEECDGFRPYRMDGKTNQGYYSLTASAVFEGSANTLQFTGSKVNTNATQSAFIVADNKGFEFTQPARDNAINLGSSTLRYKQVYAATPSISTSDAREKEEITPLDAAAMTQFLMDLQPVSYKFKGNEYLRTHFGLLAQDVNAAMQKNRMNSLDFAGYINSPVLDENRQIIGETFGLRYEEFIPLILAVLQAQQRKIDLLVQQADELEARKI